ncbi:MAG: hypothetical protein H0T69_03545 [Thermoleophilaceae bacterium]|nr:hypothetical protein [Thermoleophilaceae bacterium]
MGVLDDAIREHLELKRRHGAAEEDLRRQEAEALGPPRREVAPGEAEDGNGTGEQSPADVEAAEPARVEHDAPPDADATFDEEHGAGPESSERPEPEADPEGLDDEGRVPTPDDEAPAPTLQDEAPAPTLQDEPAAEPHSPAADELDLDDHGEHEPARAGDTPAQGFEALDDDLLEDDEAFSAGEDEPSGDDADLLEDTPDFLQETPEHDRLWFEQKPPRDFDFD